MEWMHWVYTAVIIDKARMFWTDIGPVFFYAGYFQARVHPWSGDPATGLPASKLPETGNTKNGGRR